MCLTVAIKMPKNKFGYKVFSRTEGILHSQCQTRDPYPLKKWIHNKSKIKKLQTEDDKTDYPNGFHVFLDRKSAQLWKADYNNDYDVIKRVQVADILCIGTQSLMQNGNYHRLPIIITNAIKIL